MTLPWLAHPRDRAVRMTKTSAAWHTALNCLRWAGAAQTRPRS